MRVQQSFLQASNLAATSPTSRSPSPGPGQDDKSLGRTTSSSGVSIGLPSLYSTSQQQRDLFSVGSVVSLQSEMGKEQQPLTTSQSVYPSEQGSQSDAESEQESPSASKAADNSVKELKPIIDAALRITTPDLQPVREACAEISEGKPITQVCQKLLRDLTTENKKSRDEALKENWCPVIEALCHEIEELTANARRSAETIEDYRKATKISIGLSMAQIFAASAAIYIQMRLKRKLDDKEADWSQQDRKEVNTFKVKLLEVVRSLPFFGYPKKMRNERFKEVYHEKKD